MPGTSLMPVGSSSPLSPDTSPGHHSPSTAGRRASCRSRWRPISRRHPTDPAPEPPRQGDITMTFPLPAPPPAPPRQGDITMTFPLPAQPPVYDEYEQHRTQEGMYRSDSLDAWIVSSFEMCQAVEEDEAHFVRTDHPEVTTPEEYALIERMQGGPRSLQLIKG